MVITILVKPLKSILYFKKKGKKHYTSETWEPALDTYSL